MRTYSLEKVVEGLEELALLSILGFERLHTRVRFKSRAVDPRNDGSQCRVVVHIAQPAGKFDKKMDGPSSGLRLVMAENERYDPTCTYVSKQSR